MPTPDASVYLFKDVPMTPDYSVTVDIGGDSLFNYLQSNQNIVWYDANFNYYRLPDVIRIEGNYEQLRKCTYGCLILKRGPNTVGEYPHDRYLYFWVDGIRLVKQNTAVTMLGQMDTVELEVREDVWANNNGNYTVVDSFVERRHMPRWDSSTPPQPLYYADAEQGVTGAYQLEDTQDAYKNDFGSVYWSLFHQNYDVKMFFIQVNVLDTNGDLKIIQTPVAIGIGDEGEYWELAVYPGDKNDPNYSDRFLKLSDFVENNYLNQLNITADFIQSIMIYPYTSDAMDHTTVKTSSSDLWAEIDTANVTGVSLRRTGGSPDRCYLEPAAGSRYLFYTFKADQNTVTPVAPDKTHIEGDGTGYDEYHEPMMFHSPARIRKIVTSFGGTVIDIPDIAAFRDTVSLQNLSDLAAGSVFIFMGTDMVEANSIGACGSLECAALPIYNSAWRSYEAINKVGDEIAYNAKQMQTAGNALMGAGTGAALGTMMSGNPIVGGIMAVASIGGGISAGYGNAEELRAKQTTVRNSPCNVKASGSGLTAAINGFVTLQYITLRMDDQTMERLRNAYYWYGYRVNRTFKGALSLKTRKRFDFIKTNGNRIRGSVTAEAAQRIGEIFDRGVTIYHVSSLTDFQQVGDGTMYDNDEV